MGVQAYSRAGGELLFGKSNGGRLLMRSSKFLSNRLRVQVALVEVVAVAVWLVAMLVVSELACVALAGAGCERELSCVRGAMKCASRVDCRGLVGQPVSLYLWLELLNEESGTYDDPLGDK